MGAASSSSFQGTFSLLVLLAPALMGLIVGLLPPGWLQQGVNSRSKAVADYYERTRGQSGFFLRWTLRPALWINNKIFQSTEGMDVGANWKAAIRLGAAIYLGVFVAMSMYVLFSLIVGLVLIGIAYFIIAKVQGWDTSRVTDGIRLQPKPRGPYPGDAAKTRGQEDMFGRRYAEHRDNTGSTVGTSRPQEDWLGRPYMEHKDSDGNVTGKSSVKDGLFSQYEEHRDSEGNLTGTSKKREGLFGDFVEHTDADGRVVGKSRQKEDWLGRPYTEHEPKE